MTSFGPEPKYALAVGMSLLGVDLTKIRAAFDSRCWPNCMDRPCVASWICRAATGLALLYPALAWSRSLLAIMDIRARPISFSDRPSKASWVTRSRTRRRDRSPSPQIQLADLGGYLLLL